MARICPVVLIVGLAGCGSKPLPPPPDLAASPTPISTPVPVAVPVATNPTGSSTSPGSRPPGLTPGSARPSTTRPTRTDADPSADDPSLQALLNTQPVRTVTPDHALPGGAYDPVLDQAQATRHLIREFGLLAPFPVGADLQARRGQLRDLLTTKSGTRAERPMIPAGQPANAFQCIRDLESVSGSSKKLYGRLATHLRLAEVLLEQPQADVQRSGLAIVTLTGYHALQKARDPALAALIADTWLIPARALPANSPAQPVGEPGLLVAAQDWYEAAGEWEKLAAVACLSIEANSDSRNAADAGRRTLSRALEQLERFSDAALVLSEITDPGLKGTAARIPLLWERDRAQRQAVP